MKTKAVVIIGAILMMAAVSWAATCPELGQLGLIAGGGTLEPNRVAAGDHGVVYVSDFFNNTVKSLDKSGQVTRSMAVTRPLGIAVDSTGKVYVGRTNDVKARETGAVDVFSADFVYLYSLGKGWGEFSYPISIATDAASVYVADSNANMVKVYDRATGAYKGKVGVSGTTDGSLANPTAVAVNPATGNLIIADRAKYYTDSLWIIGAGVHEFTPAGGFVRRLPVTYGFEDLPNKMVAPSGVVVDGAGRVLVSDFIKGDIKAFDGTGNYICSKPLSSGVSVSPEGLALGPDGRLLVANPSGVLTFSTEEYVAMQVSPDKINAAAQKCGPAVADKALTVSNVGAGVLKWTVSSDVAWLTPSVAAGELNGQGSAGLSVTVDTASLSAGDHQGTLSFLSQGDAIDIVVKVTAYDAPKLEVAGGGFDFTVAGGTMPSAGTLNIMLSGDKSGTLGWTASADMAWVGVSPASGQSDTSSMALVGVNASALEALGSGKYAGTVTVSAGCEAVAPVTVPVALTYIKGGTIKVETNVAEAGFSIIGPESYKGTGKSFGVEAAPEGTYEIRFDGVAGFKAPASYSLSVANGQTAVFKGQYKDLRELNGLVVSMGKGGYWLPDEVKSFDAAGVSTGSLVVSSGATSAKGGAKKSGSSTATGDVDGDGTPNLIVGHDSGIVTVYGPDCSAELAGGSFRAFSYKSDIEVAAGDLDGDGKAEIIVASGTDNGLSATVRVFKMVGGNIADTGVNFVAYQKNMGVNIAAGDIDGDGVAEIATTLGGQGARTVEVRLWKVDTAAGLGAWGVTDAGFFEAGESASGADVALADINADDTDEVLVVTAAASGGSSAVSAYTASGGRVAQFSVPAGGGLYLAAGDLDFDGSAEIAVGDSATAGSTVRVYEADGSQVSAFKAYNTSDISGAKVSIGQPVGQ